MVDKWWQPLGLSDTATPAEAFGRAVKDARDAAGLSQEGLARRLKEVDPSWNVMQSTVAKIEKGRRPVSIEDVLRLALALGIEPAELLHLRSPELAEVRRLQYELASAETAATEAVLHRNDVQERLNDACRAAGIDVKNEGLVEIVSLSRRTKGRAR